MLACQFIFFFALLAFAGTAANAQSIHIERIRSEEKLESFKPAEWKISLPRDYKNPFDQREITVDALLKAPDGKEVRVPCYWDTGSGGKTHAGCFMLRFAPTTAGEWQLVIEAKDAGERSVSSSASFTVASSARPGFVRRADGTPYFRKDSGHSIFLIGSNVAWVNSGGLKAYEEYFEKITKNGGNFVRIWMSNPQPSLENKSLGVGKYDPQAAEYFDQLFALADRYNIVLMIAFMNHRDLLVKDMWGNAQWPDSPYNAANGGPCKTPAEFISSSEAQALYKNRLRYIVARYSAFTSVAFWELWNEQDYTEIDIPPSWTNEMAGYLRKIDPNQHLITTSYGRNEQEMVWRNPNIDLVQLHYYGGSGAADCVPGLSFFHSRNSRFGKPTFVGELGIGWDGSDEKSDPKGTGTNMHNGLWISTLTGGAGAAAMWWWDNYLDQHDLWSTFRGISRFAGTIEWANRKFKPLSLPPIVDTKATDQTYANIDLALIGSWKKFDGNIIKVDPSGKTSAPVPSFQYGPEKTDLKSPTILEFNLEQPGKFVVTIDLVSDVGVLRATVEGEPKADWFFSALPGMPDQEEQQLRDGTNFARINKQRTIDLPAGKHRVELRCVGGDWVSLSGIRIENGRPAKFAAVESYALQDSQTGETLIWLHDISSNWKNDLAGITPQKWNSLEITVPAASSRSHKIEWWDTRKGEILRTDEMTPSSGQFILHPPEFTRDIAVRLYAE